jgi:hypothetical protein
MLYIDHPSDDISLCRKMRLPNGTLLGYDSFLLEVHHTAGSNVANHMTRHVWLTLWLN